MKRKTEWMEVFAHMTHSGAVRKWTSSKHDRFGVRPNSLKIHLYIACFGSQHTNRNMHSVPVGSRPSLKFRHVLVPMCQCEKEILNFSSGEVAKIETEHHGRDLFTSKWSWPPGIANIQTPSVVATAVQQPLVVATPCRVPESVSVGHRRSALASNMLKSVMSGHIECGSFCVTKKVVHFSLRFFFPGHLLQSSLFTRLYPDSTEKFNWPTK